MPNELTLEQMRSLPRERRQELPRYREAALGEFNEEKRTVTMSFASDTPCINWWGDKEILRCTDEAVNTERFAGGVMPVLFNHKRDTVIGKPLKIWTENGRALAEIEFARTDKAEEIMGLVRDGFIRGVSVGYRVSQWLVVEKGEKTEDGIEGPAYIATRWEVFEVSIVTVPADASVGVGRSMPYYNELMLNKERGIENMTNEPVVPNQVIEPAASAAAANVDAAREAAVRAERERAGHINALAAQFNIENEQRDSWLNNGTDVETVQRELLNILAKRNTPVAQKQTATVGETDLEKRYAAYRDAIMLRSGIQVEKPADGAEQMRGMGVREMVRDLLQRKGERGVDNMDADELFVRAMTTGTLPTLCQDVARATLTKGFDAANVTYDRWAYIGSLADFRKDYRVEVGAEAEPIQIPENGEFTDLTLKEGKKFAQLYTYGRSFSYTRQMFINDDQSVLTEVPAMLAEQCNALINRLAYAALVDATYTTGVNLGTGGPISTATVAEAMKLLRTRKDPNNNKRTLRIMPKALVVPVSLAVTAGQLLNSAADPSAAHAGVKNVFANAFELVTDAELDALDTKAWYLLGEARKNYGVEVDFLNGKHTPTIESQASFDTLAWRYRMYIDFGVKLMDTLSIVKNSGVVATGA
nr:MAG TPA: major capsid protein [Caudoviricetes sp.]